MSTDNIWDCEYFVRCKSNQKCLECGPDQRFLDLPENKNRQKYRDKAKQNTVTVVSDNSGQTLEDYIRDNLNNVPTIKEYLASRQAGSGNIWFMPGDVTDTVLLTECKERLTVDSKGEKNMTIPKAMLEKIEEEARLLNKYPALAFRYKGDESGKTYIINDFDTLCEMVHEIKVLRHDHQVQSSETKLWKDVAEQQHQEILRLRRKLEEEATEW